MDDHHIVDVGAFIGRAADARTAGGHVLFAPSIAKAAVMVVDGHPMLLALTW
jgi:hypothetical protein